MAGTITRLSAISATTQISAARPAGYPAEPGAATNRRRIVCPHCNFQNQIGPEIALDHALCTHCGEPLISKQAVDLTPRRYRQQVLGNDLPVVVLFWAPDAYPEDYRMNAEFAAAATHLAAQARFCRINIAEYPGLAQEVLAEHPPVLAIFQNGRETARWTTELPMPDLVEWIRAHAQLPRPETPAR